MRTKEPATPCLRVARKSDDAMNRDDILGAQAGESFQLLEMLGRGGFARTYRARVIDRELVEEYGTDEIALKIPHDGMQRALRRDFEVNAMLHVRLKPLRSVNLVRYLGVEIFAGKLVMAMEYVPDGSLRKKIGALDFQSPLTVTEAVGIAEGVLSGLSTIHQENIFHRDIKPENILMDGGTPKVADMGISRMLEANELALTVWGTKYYVSPEILGSTGADFRSDLWSTGVTLYEMVTGKLPFGDTCTPNGTMADLIRHAEPEAACEVNPVIPRALSDIIAKALRKDPNDRFQTADEMREALSRFRRYPDDLIDREISAVRGLGALGSPALESRLLDLTNRYPNSAKVYQELGEFYNGSQRFSEAVPVFKRGIQHDPSSAHLHFDLALAYKGLGRIADFVQCMKQAVGLDRTLERYAAVLLSTVANG